jgi:type VI secretion system protein ImpH
METMGTYGWRQSRSVADALFEEGHLFGFDQALRLLELIYRNRTPVAEGVDPESEVVRLRSMLRFDFPASEIEQIERPQGDGPAGMSVNVMGLAGVLGPLPSWVSELALDRASRGDKAFAAFLDLFNHRLLSLLYRARKKHRPALDGRSPERGRVAACLFAMLGLGTPHTRGVLGVPDRALLPWAGILTMRQRSMTGLERMVASHFDVAATIVPFRGLWQDIEESDTTRIGDRNGQHQILGHGAVLGKRVWDPEASFEVRLGPMTRAQFLEFLPRRFCFRSAVSLVRFYVGEDVGFTLRLVLRGPEIPELRLGKKGGAMLGWTSWLKSRAATTDDTQVTLMGHA